MGKLLPLAVLAVAAPGRVRRFALGRHGNRAAQQVVGVAVGLGAPLGASLLWAGVGSYGLSHATGLRELATDPRGSIRDYLLHRSPGDMFADAVELGLTVIPIRVGGKDAAWEIVTYLGGETVVMYTDELRGSGQSFREAHPTIRQQIAMNDATPGVAPANAPPSGVTLDPPWHEATKSLPVSDNELVVGRSGLDPSTAYEVPGRGTYYTDASGDVSFVVESKSGSIDIDLDSASSGVVYVENDGVAFVKRADGGLWAVAARVR